MLALAARISVGNQEQAMSLNLACKLKRMLLAIDRFVSASLSIECHSHKGKKQMGTYGDASGFRRCANKRAVLACASLVVQSSDTRIKRSLRRVERTREAAE